MEVMLWSFMRRAEGQGRYGKGASPGNSWSGEGSAEVNLSLHDQVPVFRAKRDGQPLQRRWNLCRVLGIDVNKLVGICLCGSSPVQRGISSPIVTVTASRR